MGIVRFFFLADGKTGSFLETAVASSGTEPNPSGMSLKVNMRLLETESVCLDADIPGLELAPDFQDELIRLVHPVEYELTVDKQADGLLVVGRLSTRLECDCARCLKTFLLPLEIPEFSALVPLTGEDAIVVEGDFIDLTPVIREDILIALPTSPLCSRECRGLKPKAESNDVHVGESFTTSVWSALNNLKL